MKFDPENLFAVLSVDTEFYTRNGQNEVRGVEAFSLPTFCMKQFSIVPNIIILRLTKFHNSFMSAYCFYIGKV